MKIPAPRVETFPCVEPGCPGEYLATRQGMVCFCGSEMPSQSLAELSEVYDLFVLEDC